MTRILLLLLILCQPAWATQDQWPAIHDVIDVASDDVLNIREAPSASAPIIGVLAHDATEVEVLRPNDRETWALVNVGETTGWVSLRYLARRPGQWFGGPLALRSCFGTEPYWSLDISPDGALTWSTPETAVTGTRGETWFSENHRGRQSFSARLYGDGPSEIMATLALDDCSDFMTNREFGISIDLLIGGLTGAQMYSGCCSLAP